MVGFWLVGGCRVGHWADSCGRHASGRVLGRHGGVFPRLVMGGNEATAELFLFTGLAI